MTLAIAACALAGALVSPAAAANPAQAPAAAVHAAAAAPFADDPFSDPRLKPLTCRGGFIQIGWEGQPFSDKDWYGLYSEKPDPKDWSKGLVTGQWEWVTTAPDYRTNQVSGQFWSAYWTPKPDGTYDLVAKEGPEYKHCKL
ncbi:hypothetical protein OG625_20380 [Streptomyces sp. NBC_01351]|uniref:hypothetical protein n=1 Tax=Streptomyces sp. NBC_01351 TaxID=2903833 RepID=UPI002E37F977|nr:hypothetical protein [Streptomyces sp. NBC_01351]